MLIMDIREAFTQHGAQVFTHPSTSPTPTGNSLDDIFSDSPSVSPSLPHHINEPSDIPRIRSTHSTAGYRAGISASKTNSLQPGFDQGYSLGAAFGLRVGYLLGVLETLYAATNNAPLAERDRVRALQVESRKDLSLERIFAKEWWGEDGVWKYTVHNEDGQDSNGDSNVTFDIIARCHPILNKWGHIVDKEMEGACVDRHMFGGAEWETGRVEDKDLG